MKRPRIDLFLFHYVTARTARDTRITHLYQEFRRWWVSAERDLDGELDRLGTYADASLDSGPPSDSGSRYDVFARRLRMLDTSTVYPVLLHLVVAEGFSEAELDRVAEVVESFLVGRMVRAHAEELQPALPRAPPALPHGRRPDAERRRG